VHLHSSQHFDHKCWVYWEKGVYFFSLNENYCHQSTNYSSYNLNFWLQRKTADLWTHVLSLLRKKIFNFCLQIRICNVWYLLFFMSKSTLVRWLDGRDDKGATLVSKRLWVRISTGTFCFFLYKQLLSTNISLFALKNLSIH